MFLFQRGVKLGFEIFFLNNHDCRKFGRRKDRLSTQAISQLLLFFKKIIKENGTVFQGGTNQKKKIKFSLKRTYTLRS